MCSAALGIGTHFSTDAGYSIQARFAPKNRRGFWQLIFARVLTGLTTRGDIGMKEPPNLLGSRLYDTTCNRLPNPSDYCVLNDAMALPAFLIKVKMYGDK